MLIMWAGGGNAPGSASADVPSPASAAAPSPASATASGGNAPGSASAAAPQALLPRERTKCRHHTCTYLVHADPQVSVAFCCIKCQLALGKGRDPEHGQRCEHQQVPQALLEAVAQDQEHRLRWAGGADARQERTVEGTQVVARQESSGAPQARPAQATQYYSPKEGAGPPTSPGSKRGRCHRIAWMRLCCLWPLEGRGRPMGPVLSFP